MTSLDLSNIASAGGNIIVNGDDFNKLDLNNIASAGRSTNAKLTIIYKSNKLSALDCANIASANPGNVTFDFTK